MSGRRLAWSAAVLIPLGAGVLVAWMLATETGGRMLLKAMSPGLPEELSIAGIEGRWSGDFTLLNVRWETPDLRVHLARVDVVWRPGALVEGRIGIDLLRLTDLCIEELADAGGPTVLPQQVTLPLGLSVDALIVAPLRYVGKGDAPPVVIERVDARLAFESHRLELAHLAVRGAAWDVAGAGRLDAGDRYGVNARFTGSAQNPGGRAYRGTLRLGGDLSTLSLSAALSAPVTATLDATVEDPLDQARFQYRAQVSEVELSRLDPDLPDWPVAVELAGDGDLDGVTAHGSATGTLPEVGPVTAALDEIRYGHGSLDIGRLELTSDRAPGAVTFAGRMDASRRPYAVSGDLTWRELEWAADDGVVITSPEGRLILHGDLDNLSGDLNTRLGPRGMVEGTVVVREGSQATLDVSWTHLEWPDAGSELGSPEGRLQLDGDLRDYELELNARLRSASHLPVRLEARGQGDRQGLRLRPLALESGGAALTGQADVHWDPEIRVVTELAGKGLDPAVFQPHWEGRVDVVVRASAGESSSGWTGRLEELALRGMLRGRPLEVVARGQAVLPGRMEADLSLRAGDTRGTLAGNLAGEQVELRWQLSSPDLSVFWPGLRGRAAGEGGLTGDRQRPHVTAELSGSGLGFGSSDLGQATLDADVHLDDRHSSRVELALHRVRVEGLRLESLGFSAAGRLAGHDLRIRGQGPAGRVDTRLRGQLGEADWSVLMRSADVTIGDRAPWRLESPVRAHLARDGAAWSVSSGCWRSDEARACAEGQRAQGSLSARARLERLPLEVFEPWLPPGTRVTGRLDGDGRIQRGAGSGTLLRLNLANSEGSLVPADRGRTRQVALRFEPGSARVDLAPGRGLTLAAALPLEEGGGLWLDLAAPAADDNLLDDPLRGRLRIDIRDLGFVTALSREIEDLEGAVTGGMQVTGTVARPVFRGRVGLEGGAATLATPGIRLEDLTLALEASGEDDLALQGHARSGGGTLELTGAVAPFGSAPGVSARLKGSDFLAMDTYEARIVVSPDLRIDAQQGRIAVTGELPVPAARIRLKELPEGAVRVSRDEVIVGAVARSNGGNGRGSTIEAEVRLVLGEAVSFRGFGLTADLRGAVLLKETPGRVTTASGDIRVIDGRYRAYGQDLQIEEGRLLFAGGPADNPGLFVRAVRRNLKNLRVGVQVTGTLRRPTLELFSDPPMSRQEQLSYLILGRPPGDAATAQEQGTVNEAALALGLGGQILPLEAIGEGVGLDEIGVEGGGLGAGDDTALVVGKYLSPRLYISYGLGLFEPVSTIRLVYDITRRWKVVTESKAAGSGLDIFYTFEN